MNEILKNYFEVVGDEMFAFGNAQKPQYFPRFIYRNYDLLERKMGINTYWPKYARLAQEMLLVGA